MKGEGVGGGGLHSSTLPLVRGFLDGRGPAEREGRWRGGGEERMEGRGGAGVAFVCFPRFKASLEK